MKNIGLRGFNKSSSDDRPGPGICDSKYVEDAKAARSVRVWDRVPMKNTRLGGIEISGLCRCSASLTSVSQHGCLVFFGARLSCSPP